MTFLRGAPLLLVWTGGAGAPSGDLRLLDVSPRTNEAARAGRELCVADRTVAGQIMCVAVHPGDHQFVTGNSEGWLDWWSLPELQHLGRIKVLQGAIYGLAFSPDGQRLATGGTDSVVRLWSVVTRTTLGTYRGHRAQVTSVAFSPDGSRLLTASYDGTCKFWDATLDPNTGRIQIGQSFSGGGIHGYIGSACWIAENGKELMTYSTNHLPELRTMDAGVVVGPPRRLLPHLALFAFSSVDARTALVQADTNRLEVWDLPRERRIAALSATIDASSRRGHLVSRDNRFLYEVSLADQTGRLWDLGSEKLLQVTNVGASYYNYFVMAFSPDSHMLARPNRDRMELYDIRAGQTLRTLPSVWTTGSVAFSPDGRRLAIANYNYVVLWDIASGRQVLTPLSGHQDYLIKIAFSPDGKTLLTGSQDCSLRMWNLATGQQVATVPETYSFALSSDGSTLAVYTYHSLRFIYVPPMAEFDQMDGPQGWGR